MLKVTNVGKIEEKLQQILKENNQLNQTIKELKEKLAANASQDLLKDVTAINGHNVLIKKVEMETGEIKPLAQQLVEKLSDAVVLLYTVNGEKVTFVAACSPQTIAKGIKASTVVKTAAQATGGNGGGKDDLASAGGKDSSKLTQAIEAVKELLK